MRRLVEWFRRTRRRIAGRLVTWHCDRVYRKAVEHAEARHSEDGNAFYVVDHPVREGRLVVISRREFRGLRERARRDFVSRPEGRIFWDNGYNMSKVKDGCWYHTADRGGNNAMDERTRNLRRLMFLRIGLRRAGLVETK